MVSLCGLRVEKTHRSPDPHSEMTDGAAVCIIPPHRDTAGVA
jgi:hypothetical protein